MRLLTSACIGIACTTACTLVLAASSDHTHVTLKAEPGKGILASYEWPSGCSQPPHFLHGDPTANGLHARVVPAPPSSGMTVKNYEVPLAKQPGDGRYPWAHPEGPGMYVYLNYYMVGEECGAVEYSLDAPGVMLSQGIEAGPLTVLESEIKDKSALLFPPAPGPGPRQDIYVDPALDEPARHALLDVFSRGRDFFKRALPRSDYPPTGVVIGFLKDESTYRGYGGDATNIIRLNYVNLPQPLDKATLTSLELVMLHEVAHRFHPESMANNALHPVPGEGAADFLRWFAALQLGIIDKAQAAAVLGAALSSCIEHTGDKPWLSLTAQQRTANHLPYDCGFSAYALGLALRQADGTALDRMDNLFSVDARLPSFDFPRAVECGSIRTCEPRWLMRLFGNQESFRQVVKELQMTTCLVSSEPESAAESQMRTMHSTVRYSVNIDALLAQLTARKFSAEQCHSVFSSLGSAAASAA